MAFSLSSVSDYVTNVGDKVQQGTNILNSATNTYNSVRSSLNNAQDAFNDVTGMNGSSGGGGGDNTPAPSVVPTTPANTYVPPVSSVPQAYTPVFYNQNPTPAATPAAGMSTNMIIGLAAGGFFFLVLMVVVVIIATKK